MVDPLRIRWIVLTRAYTTVGAADVEIEIKRSRFCCRLRRVDSEAAARAVVDEARTAEWQARHHCSAFIIGPESDLRRSSDDGEPAGTAGRPMLEVLARNERSDVVAVVSRYFGGVKLGAGGLARAYGDAVARAVEHAPTVHRLLMREHTLSVSHADAGRVEHALRAERIAVVDLAYAADVTITLAVPEDDTGELSGRLAALGIDAASLRPGASRWWDAP